MRKVFQLALLVGLTAAQLPAAEMANLRNGFSIRHERHELVGDKTRLHLSNDADAGFVDVVTAEVESFEPAPAEVTKLVSTPIVQKDLATIVSDASVSSRIDADFIASMIRAESGNNPRAVSPKGAQGLMQLMPQTASALGVTNSFDPEKNVDGGVRYLRALLVQYNGDAAKALAAYNAGPHRVQQYGGVPPYHETRAYVARVINEYNRKKLAEMRRQSQSPTKAHQASAGREVAASGTSAGGK